MRWENKVSSDFSYFLSSTSARNYLNRLMYINITANQRWDIFWDSVVNWCTYILICSRHQQILPLNNCNATQDEFIEDLHQRQYLVKLDNSFGVLRLLAGHEKGLLACKTSSTNPNALLSEAQPYTEKLWKTRQAQWSQETSDHVPVQHFHNLNFMPHYTRFLQHSCTQETHYSNKLLASLTAN